MEMGTGLLLQYAVVALAVIASAWVVFVKQFPLAARRLRVAVAVPMVREGRPRWMVRMGQRIAPPRVDGGDGCGTCSGCAPPRG